MLAAHVSTTYKKVKSSIAVPIIHLQTSMFREKLKRIFAAIALVGLVFSSAAPLALASSHREAPLIAGDPKADATDVYAFVSPDKKDTVTIIANLMGMGGGAGNGGNTGGTGNGGNTGGTGGTGTSTPPSSSFTGTISPTNTTVPAGERLDFNGRNFSHETDVKITLDGKMVGSVHADGGGNFSTGSIMAPTADGVYTYIFSEVGTSNTLNSVITVGNGSSATTTSQ